MILTMMELGIEIEREHHEVATAGQAEIDIRYTSLLKCADKMCIYKYVVKKRRLPARQDRHLHAQATLWRQWLGDAYATSRSGKLASRPFMATAMPDCPGTSVFHWRFAEALSRPLRDYQSDE